MKSFVIAVFLFSITLLLLIGNSIFTGAVLRHTESLVERTEGESTFASLHSYWETHRFYLGIGAYYEPLNRVEDSLLLLENAVREKQNLAHPKKLLLENLHALYDTETLCLSSFL